MIRNGFYIFLITFILTGSCHKGTDNDQSLTQEEFAYMGMPDPYKIWEYRDYLNACKLLDNLIVFKPHALPRKESEKSGMYFDRIINQDNFSFLSDESIPLNERAYEIQKFVDIQGLLITIYTDLNNNEQYYNRELVDLYIFGLTVGQHMLDLGQRINESIEDDDISMQYGFESIQEVYKKMLLFVLENQEKAYMFPSSDLEKLTDYISGSVLLNKDWMDEVSTGNLKQSIQKVINSSSSNYVRDKYQHIIDEL